MFHPFPRTLMRCRCMNVMLKSDGLKFLWKQRDQLAKFWIYSTSSLSSQRPPMNHFSDADSVYWSRTHSTRFVENQRGVSNVFLTCFDYFFWRINTNLGVKRKQRGVKPPTPDKSSTENTFFILQISSRFLNNLSTYSYFFMICYKCFDLVSEKITFEWQLCRSSRRPDTDKEAKAVFRGESF